MPGQTNIKLDTRVLDRLRKEAPDRADRVVGKIANDWGGDMQTHMNTRSPAPAGEPPGVDTGYLKNSIVARRIRQMVWGIYGARYGLYLELGTVYMAARPFILPSARRIVKTIPKAFKGFVK